MIDILTDYPLTITRDITLASPHKAVQEPSGRNNTPKAVSTVKKCNCPQRDIREGKGGGRPCIGIRYYTPLLTKPGSIQDVIYKE